MPSVSKNTANALFASELGIPSEVVSAHEVDLGELPETQVEVEMLVSSVNPLDILIITGNAPIPLNNKEFKLSASEENQGKSNINSTVLGTEGVGRVTKIGAKAKKATNGDLEVGDYVIPFNFGDYGSWSTKIYLDPSNLVVFKNREGITARDLSSVNINISTAYRMILDIEKLNVGDYIIQNGANSGVGKYVIQLANAWGFKTINVIRDRSDFDKVADDMKKLGADIVIKDTELDSSSTKDLLGSLSSPIRLGLNFVNGSNAAKMASHLSPGSTLATYGMVANDPIPIYPTMLLLQRIKIVGFSIFAFYQTNPIEERVKTWEGIVSLLRSKKIKAQDSELVALYDEENNNKHYSSEKIKELALGAINSSKKTTLLINKD
ncbi:Trans-2-enoyl-CoA reductase, mitochondrial [Smittium culicis]|uniref:enoyl-[acyl-carrier-protein] reductase n=1 Tax=Smittium culicis TaxID=133412 RepID=A0A1R1XYM3_9FUNG|nr:Trans-2-enoyl-CoA reductase, mitochondrial [Smittium culicis]